jgi:Protein of unknown function (DUF3179)
MKKIFYFGIIGLIIFEILNVYCIMPMPGSQKMNSIDFAYFIYKYRWFFRAFFGIAILIGFQSAFNSKKWLAIASALVAVVAIYLFNFNMAADAMFHQPQSLRMLPSKTNKITNDRIVIGIERNGEAKAYPVSLIGYHHQVIDTIAGQPIMVTYCTVCRTGRIFEPKVKGSYEKFRLVGMDHFNAMFEDETTKSWWRQATGESIIGPLKGEMLTELQSQQTTLGKWLSIHKNSLVMQADENYKESYDSTYKYERGKSVGDLTKTDSLSWKEKSWVVGVAVGSQSKAYDWNRLVKEKTINDVVGGKPIVLTLAKDKNSFFAFERPSNERFVIKNDTLKLGNQSYNLKGELVSLKGGMSQLKPIKAYQEFWHSWRTFHPNTLKY